MMLTITIFLAFMVLLIVAIMLIGGVLAGLSHKTEPTFKEWLAIIAIITGCFLAVGVMANIAIWINQ